MEQLRVTRYQGRPRTRPDAVRGDKAYSSRAIRAHFRARGVKVVIPEPDVQKGHRRRRAARGSRPVSLDTADYKNRNVIERQYCHLKTMARPRRPLRQGRHRLPRCRAPQRRHHLDENIVRHVLGRVCSSA
ncbi:hypothetical protein CQ040_15750 [Microbacterium sp. MYb54]|nr:hypothetical protein CQ032_15100 [Microbacterium sp. MYb43]PQZ75094.1 hypothetical protein CQ031_14455 [Microbacterium sp. MYb40]PRB19388.1 hypothetical protein CQ040_15750 [Microbacterium sp. MYb54]PRB24589.1 hypothetical protein CQ037_16255 [Microbacterium sp. MYb50]PRB63700.1 hypothetical protein CQ021_15860 [Microbacterium sp. MYb24]PRB66128.1 hypothetical protein CQ027_19620 [Microbacterium sp. MYb32]